MKGYIILAITFTAVFSHAGRSWGELLIVEASGEAAVIESESQAKKDALETALRNSVKEALKPIIEEINKDAPREAIEEKIYQDPLEYIVTYKISSEGISGPAEADNGVETDEPQTESPDIYHVIVSATIDIEQLRGAFLSLMPQEVELLTVRIFMLAVEDYAAMEGLKKAIEKIETVRRLSYHSFLKRKFVLEALISSSIDDLYERISKKISGGFIVIKEGNDIVIRQGGNP